MIVEYDDPRLTDHAVGELDAAGRAEVEARAVSDPAALEAIEEIRQVAGILTARFEAEPVLKLTPSQRAAVEARAAKVPAYRAAVAARLPRLRFRLRRSIALGAAAVALIGVCIALAMLQGRSEGELFADIAHGDGAKAAAAIMELTERPPKVVTRLYQRSLDSDPRTVSRFLRAMGRRPRDEYLPHLREAVKDPRTEVKLAAMIALERHGKARDLAVFIRALRDAAEPEAAVRVHTTEEICAIVKLSTDVPRG